MDFYRELLKGELARRCEKNSRYSVRAFARALRIDAGALSRILSGTKIPSYKMALKLFQGLDLEPAARQRFLVSVAKATEAHGRRRIDPAIRRYVSVPAPPTDISVDLYRVISDWYHFAILELTFVEGFDLRARSAGRALGISAAQAALAIERLTRLGLLELRSGHLSKTHEMITTADKHLTTPALRRNQRQFLEKALHSLENDPIEERSMTSMTMAIDPEQLPLAKRMIREFNRKLCRTLEQGPRKRVYNLSVALYPIQIEKEGN